MPLPSPAGTVTDLWRFPVKSMRGERLEALTLTSRGVAGDRAFAILDVESGKLAIASNVRQFPKLLACQATVVSPGDRDQEAPVVRIDLPDGTSVQSDAGDVDQVLSKFFDREVALVAGSAPSFTANQSAFFAQAALPPSTGVGTLVDLYPVSVMTSATLAAFAAQAPESRFDQRRFRMNVYVASDQRGFVENAWVGRSLALGDGARLAVALPDPRCAMTNLAQEDLPADAEVLRLIVRHNSLPIGASGALPCAGVYAEVERPGPVRVGDVVTLDAAAR